ncbi:MAG: A/G-specific adenine glycosylase [Lawsonibacter sp.]
MNELEQLVIPLLVWYRENARILPWRSHPTPYRVWISEIMLQQTRVSAVLDYYRRFLQQAATVEELASLPEEKLMKLWQGLGYYSRARNLQKAAIQIVEQWGGIFPNTYDAIRSLPGIGDYTAGAISSIAFGIPVPAVDGNVLRVTARVCADREDISTPAMKRKITQALQQVIPLDSPGDFNQALMELGATVCLPNGAPLCQTCPIAAICRSYQKGLTDEIPVKGAKKARRVEQRLVYLLFFQDRVALRLRPKEGLLAGLWEYPNELNDGTDWPAYWGLTSTKLERGGSGKHIFSHIEWHMTALLGHLSDAELPSGWVWASRDELRDIYPIPNAFQCFSLQVEHYLGPL